MSGQGWEHEPARHSLAAKGVSTPHPKANKIPIGGSMICQECGKSILKTGSQQKYCKQCSRTIQLEKYEEYQDTKIIRAKYTAMCIIDPQEAREFYNEMLAVDGKEFTEKLLGDIYERMEAGEPMAVASPAGGRSWKKRGRRPREVDVERLFE